MEQMLASPAPLIWHLLVRRYDAVADRTLVLTFERTYNILAEGEEAINYAAILLNC
jgi:hypothetical protein